MKSCLTRKYAWLSLLKRKLFSGATWKRSWRAANGAQLVLGVRAYVTRQIRKVCVGHKPSTGVVNGEAGSVTVVGNTVVVVVAVMVAR